MMSTTSGASFPIIVSAASISPRDCATAAASSPMSSYIESVVENACVRPSSCACHGSMPMRKKSSRNARSLLATDAASPARNVRTPLQPRPMPQPSTSPTGANATHMRSARSGPAKSDSTADAATAAATLSRTP